MRKSLYRDFVKASLYRDFLKEFLYKDFLKASLYRDLLRESLYKDFLKEILYRDFLKESLYPLPGMYISVAGTNCFPGRAVAHHLIPQGGPPSNCATKHVTF